LFWRKKNPMNPVISRLPHLRSLASKAQTVHPAFSGSNRYKNLDKEPSEAALFSEPPARKTGWVKWAVLALAIGSSLSDTVHNKLTELSLKMYAYLDRTHPVKNNHAVEPAVKAGVGKLPLTLQPQAEKVTKHPEPGKP